MGARSPENPASPDAASSRSGVAAASTRPLADAPLGELLAAMRGGSAAEREAAWSACYDRYRHVVWTRVFYVIRTIPWLAEPREVAQDVASDVFVGLVDAAKHYREEGRAEYWLKQVAVRAALRAKERLTGDWSRRRTARSRSGERASRSPSRSYLSFDEYADSIVDYLDDVEREERLELERRLAALRTSPDPRRRRWAEFVDLYLQGYGFAEIGERMGLTEGTARNWLVAIRKFLATPSAGGAAGV